MRQVAKVTTQTRAELKAVQHSKKFHIKLAGALVILMTLSILIVGGLSIYWLYSSDDVLDVKNAPFPVRTVEQNGEQILVLKVNYCKNTDARGAVRTSFVSKSREVLLPMSNDSQPKQCAETDIPIIIPKELPADDYKVHFRATYQVNPFKTVVEQFDSVEFKVGQ